MEEANKPMNHSELARLDSRQSVLEQKVSTIDGRLGTIEGTLRSLDAQFNGRFDQIISKMNEGSRTPWPLLVSISSLVFLVGGSLFYLGISPLSGSITRIDRDVTTIQNGQKANVTDKDFQNFLTAYESNRQISRVETGKKFDAIEIILGKMNDNQVPRKEHEQIWAAFKERDKELGERSIERDEALSARIDEINKTIGQIVTVRDVWQQMQQRLDALERSKTAP